MFTAIRRRRWRLFSVFSALAGLAPAILVTSNALADPAERGELSLTRNAASPATMTARLLRNEYRYEEREVIDQVQVPYTVQVPYQDLETYIDPERVCGYRPRQVCGVERVCTERRVSTPVCNDLERCDAAGNCRTQRVCKDEIKAYPVCHNETRCHTVQEHACWIEHRTRTRYVTRYRTETRYRSETRRRIVTDRIFDHQWGVNVVIALAEDAELRGNETETLLLRLTGYESAPSVELLVDSAIYAYQVVDAGREAGTVRKRLRMVPKYKATDLGEATIENLRMVPDAQGRHTVRFIDRGVKSRVETRYLIVVGDIDRRENVFETEAVGRFGDREVAIPVDAELVQANDHLIRLTVERDGVVLAQPVSFMKQARQMGQLAPEPYLDVNGVRDFRIEGAQAEASLLFTDATPKDHKVETSYEIRLVRRRGPFGMFRKELAKATLKRRDLRHDDDQTPRVELKTFPGLEARELAKHLESGDQVIVELKVTRASERLKGHSPIRFEKTAKLRVK